MINSRISEVIPLAIALSFLLFAELVRRHSDESIVNETNEIVLNIGKKELLVGIEVLDATEVLGTGNIPNVVLENIPSTVA